jgi:two-component system OmpR family response regulator
VQSAAPTSGLRILIAEDNADGAESMAHVLRAAGHSVRVVADGVQAVTAALHDPPDVVLLDIGLPLLDGWEVARRIHQGLGERPCALIAISGYSQPDDQVRSRQAGIHLHLAKPVDPEELETLLSQLHRPGR